MQVTVQPSPVKGNIIAPASKSAMQRACAAALLRKGETVLKNPGVSEDDQAALRIIQQLGARVHFEEGQVRIVSEGLRAAAGGLDCGESGLSIRMFTAIAALNEEPVTITGRGSLERRPMHFFNNVLPQLGVHCQSNNGYLPITVAGPLQPKNISIDGSLSSQYLTGLLFAYAAANANDVTIEVEGLASTPYVDLTLQVLKDFGLKAPVNEGYRRFRFENAAATSSSSGLFTYAVEGDWSGAAFLLVAGAIAGEVTVTGLDVFSQQADKAVLQALMQSDAVMSIEEKEIRVRRSRLKPFHFNATHCPDLFPPLAALAAYCPGTSVIEGAGRLAHKESNRALTLQEEFGKLGIEIRLQDDLMLIEGGTPLQGATVSSHHDHRIAMACAVAALGASSEVVVAGADAVGKSYPQFWNHLAQLQS